MEGLSQHALLVAGLTISLVAVLSWRTRQIKKQHIRRYQEGIAWLQLLRVVLTKTQQHRGLSNGFLNGDQSAQTKIAQLQREISRQAKVIEGHGSWIHQTERWKAIQDHWQRLSANYMNHKASYSLEQHNKLILTILHLIEDCAEEHHLQELNNQDQQSVDHLWKSLLFNAEFIGQARALGTGVTAAQKCNSVERIRLKYLHSKLNEYKQTPSGSACAAQLTPLLSSIEQEVIVSEPKISPSDYFAMATVALDTVMLQFDQGLSELSKSLSPQG